ncbi:hypothetical protein CHCC15381_1880 [Bacillus paralicheniformis]|uniref:Uncharacterized protein n=1 Tax=Bacillus paralicheniformis TaxID=1648923 RepID=A0ABY3FZY8_9BACI|nr:hypothetical protein CHCC15381_1880 [Bacillus paralicheniformis]
MEFTLSLMDTAYFLTPFVLDKERKFYGKLQKERKNMAILC